MLDGRSVSRRNVIQYVANRVGGVHFDDTRDRLRPEVEAQFVAMDRAMELAGFPGFAELKRSLREQPQLAALGVDADAVGRQEDWHGGSRRHKK